VRKRSGLTQQHVQEAVVNITPTHHHCHSLFTKLCQCTKDDF